MIAKDVSSRELRTIRVGNRAEVLSQAHLAEIHHEADKLFIALLSAQWIAGILGAYFFLSNETSPGFSAISDLLGAFWPIVAALLIISPLFVVTRKPGTTYSRVAITFSQMLFSLIFYQLAGESSVTMFHLFGSLALLGIYRDLSVIIFATSLGVLSCLIVAMFISTPERFSSIQSALWIVFEGGILTFATRRSLEQIRSFAAARAELEWTNEAIEVEVSAHKKELADAQGMLVHIQKLESIGRLTAGIAHEINTPIQYIGSNTTFMRDQFDRIAALLSNLETFLEETKKYPLVFESLQTLHESAAALDIPYIQEEIPQALEQTLDGVEKVSSIVHSLKEFFHPGVVEKVPTDINRIVAASVGICKNEWKYVAEVELNLADSNTVIAKCFPADLGQVILNLVVNATHAIADMNAQKMGHRGLITVSTRRCGSEVEISVADNGVGIQEEIRSKVFDNFFTTKEIGRGTGQGLALTRNIVVNRHGGTVTFVSEVGKGTTFIVRFPKGIEESEEFFPEGMPLCVGDFRKTLN